MDRRMDRRTLAKGADALTSFAAALNHLQKAAQAFTGQLKAEGITAFKRSFDTLLAGVEAKRRRLAGQATR